MLFINNPQDVKIVTKAGNSKVKKGPWETFNMHDPPSSEDQENREIYKSNLDSSEVCLLSTAYTSSDNPGSVAGSFAILWGLFGVWQNLKQKDALLALLAQFVFILSVIWLGQGLGSRSLERLRERRRASDERLGGNSEERAPLLAEQRV